MPTAKCLMATGGALMTAMCMPWTRTRSAPLQPMCSSTAGAMRPSRIQVCTAQHFTTLCQQLCCVKFHCTAVQLTTLPCSDLHCNVAHASALHCISTQASAMHCTGLGWRAGSCHSFASKKRMLSGFAFWHCIVFATLHGHLWTDRQSSLGEFKHTQTTTSTGACASSCYCVLL